MSTVGSGQTGNSANASMLYDGLVLKPVVHAPLSLTFSSPAFFGSKNPKPEKSQPRLTGAGAVGVAVDTAPGVGGASGTGAVQMLRNSFGTRSGCHDCSAPFRKS